MPFTILDIVEFYGSGTMTQMTYKNKTTLLYWKMGLPAYEGEVCQILRWLQAPRVSVMWFVGGEDSYNLKDATPNFAVPIKSVANDLM